MIDGDSYQESQPGIPGLSEDLDCIFTDYTILAHVLIPEDTHLAFLPSIIFFTYSWTTRNVSFPSSP